MSICTSTGLSAANHTIDDSVSISSGINNTGDGDTLFLQPGTYDKTDNDTNIDISKNITIMGNGSTNSVIIDGKLLNRIFSIGDNSNIKFINLTFKNGYVFGFGGAVYNDFPTSQLTFINCTFENNAANLDSYAGGAIWNHGANLFLKNCIFIDNFAKDDGGAIKNIGVNCTVSDCTFINNFADYSGGAFVNTGVNCTVSNCSFMNNSAVLHGGAIWNFGDNFTVNKCIFIDNFANDSGGAIYNSKNFFVINNSSFTNNSANYLGGAIGNIGIYVTVSNSTFINNHVPFSGGSIHNFGDYFIVTNSKFINNSADNEGGAIYNLKDYCLISNSDFVNNSANYSGGAIYSLRDFLVVSNSSFMNNFVDDSGGAIYINGNNLTVTNCMFVNNRVFGQSFSYAGGGAVYIYSNINITINNSTFVNNTSNNHGGAIHNYIGRNVTMINCNFLNNSASKYGGAIFNNREMNLSGNLMSGNFADLGQMIYNNWTIGILNLTYLNNVTVKTNNGSIVTIYATITDDMGNTVTGQNITFYINGTLITSLFANEGYASLSYLADNGPDVISVTGNYGRAGTFPALINSGQIAIFLNTTATLSVPSKTKIGKTITIKYTLKDENDNPIKGATIYFYSNGKQIGSGVTDANGIAQLKYKVPKAGTFDISAQYNGNYTYVSNDESKKIKVSKNLYKVKIIKRGQRVTVTITDENGVPVSGKKVRISDSRGRVLAFGITDENGKFTFTYKGSSIYFEVSFNEANVYQSYKTRISINPNDPSNNPKTPNHSKNNNENNKTESIAKSIAMEKAGIPIIVLILVLLTSLGILVRKK